MFLTAVQLLETHSIALNKRLVDFFGEYKFQDQTIESYYFLTIFEQ